MKRILLSLLLIIFWALPTQAAITLRATYHTAINGSPPIVSGVVVVKNDLIVFTCSSYATGSDNQAPSDGVNTYHRVNYIATTTDGQPTHITMYYAVASTSATLSITSPASFSSYAAAIVGVYYGEDTTNPVDNSTIGVDSGDTKSHTSSSLSLSSATGGMMVAVWANETTNSQPDTGGGGWVVELNLYGGGAVTDYEDLAYSGSGSPTAQLTTNSSITMGFIFAGFKAGAPPGPVNYYVDPSSSFTISGSSGTFTPFEWITQATSGAQAIYNFKNGSTVTVSAVLGTPDSNHTWTGAYSSATMAPTSTPSANGSDSNAGTQVAPWASGAYSCSQVTGSQPGSAILIRAQTVCYNDTFLINCYGTQAAGNFTLSSYVANVGDGTLNPRVYASACLPTGTGSAGNKWTATSAFSVANGGLGNAYQASLSSLTWLSDTGTQGIWWDDWYHCSSSFPGFNGVGTGTYSGKYLEQGIRTPVAAYWYIGNQVWTTSNGLSHTSPPLTAAIVNAGSGYPASSTFNVQVLGGGAGTLVSSGQLSVSTNSSGNVTTINGVAQDGTTGGYLTGSDYSAGTLSTYTSNGGSGFTFSVVAGNLTTVRLIDFQAMVDTYPGTMWYDSIGKNIYIHNPYGANNPASTSGYNLWVTQNMHAIGIAGTGVKYITINGVDGYYSSMPIGLDNDMQDCFASNSIVENCNGVFAVYQAIDIPGTANQLINCNAGYGSYANISVGDAWGLNTGFQTDQITITNCSDWFPLLTAQFGSCNGGLFLDCARNGAYGLTWPSSPSGWSTFTSANPPGVTGPTASTISLAVCSSAASVTSNSITGLVSGNTYTTLMNFNPASGVAPVVTMTGATLTGSPVTLGSGWNTLHWTATGSSASFTLTTSGAANFALTPRASHQLTVNGYAMNSPGGSMTGSQDYFTGLAISYSSNLLLSNITAVR